MAKNDLGPCGKPTRCNISVDKGVDIFPPLILLLRETVSPIVLRWNQSQLAHEVGGDGKSTNWMKSVCRCTGNLVLQSIWMTNMIWFWSSILVDTGDSRAKHG